MAEFVDPKTGELFANVPDAEAETAQTKFGLVPAEQFERERAAAAKPLGQKVIETAGTVGAGLASAGNVIGDVLPEALGGLSDAEVAQFDREFSGSQQVRDLKEEHPIAFALGSNAPAIALGPAVDAAAGGGILGGVTGALAESAAVGYGDEAIAAGAEGREFDESRAVEGARTDLAFSAAANALTGVVGRVGNLFLFGGGNAMAKNVGRGLDASLGPVVPDDIRFESPLLEAETRSTRAAAAAGPGMPPGPARDEALRRAASDLNEQARTQGGEALESTVAAARESASVADSEVVQRRIDDMLTETTPAQTSWSADATQRLDTLRKQLSIDTERVIDGSAAPVGEAEAIRAIGVADEAIRAIDGSGDSAEWFKASAAARDRLDAIADTLPEASPAAKTIADARDWLGRSLADRGLFGGAADLDSALRGAARDKVGAAARTVGGDLRGHVAAYVAADSAGRAGLRAPIDQAIEGIEELAVAHERFGTATPAKIEAMKESAASLRKRIALADDVRAAESRATAQVAEETPEKASMVEEAAERVAEHLKSGGKAALGGAIGRAFTTIADFSGIPGAGWVARKIQRKVGNAVADQVIAAAKRLDPQTPGAARARRIIDRMRAREAQRGSVTVGGGKLDNGWTEAEYEAKMAAFKARQAKKAAASAAPAGDLADVQMPDKDGYLEPVKPGSARLKRVQGQIQDAAENAIAGKSLDELSALPIEGPGAAASREKIEAFKRDKGFRETGLLPSNNDRGRGGLPAFGIEPDGRVYLSNGRHRVTAAQESGQTHIVANLKKYDKKGNVIWDYVGPVRVNKAPAPTTSGESGFVDAGGERQFSLGDVAKSPVGVVTGAGAAWLGVNQLRDERLETADRVLAVDDAAQQRVRHTARVLAGLAEPPSAEGLTTALGRFGEEYGDPRAAFEERKSILEKAATAPALVYDVIGSALGDVAKVSPELFQAASQRLLEGFDYLRQNLPAEVKTSLLYPTGMPPSESAMRDWATQWNTVMNPESVLDDIDRGTVSHLQIRTLQGAHADIYQALRTEIIGEVGANFETIPWSTKMQLDILFQADGLAGPMFSSKAAAMIGEAMQTQAQRKAPGPADTSGDAAADGPSGLNAIKTSVTNRGS